MGCSTSSAAHTASAAEALSALSEASGVDISYQSVHIDLSNSRSIMGEAGGDLIARALRHVPRLETLNLSGSALGPQGVLSVAGGLSTGKPARLVSLNLSATWGSAGGHLVVTALAKALQAGKFASLTAINLSDNAVEPAGALALAAALKAWRPPLRQLRLADCQVGATGCKAICEALLSMPFSAKDAPHGRGGFTLDLFANQVSSEGASALGELLASRAVPFHSLCCKDCAFGP
jgi:Ran GTPase-activating protein (RanGAP) involved in mRNA processing and transport